MNELEFYNYLNDNLRKLADLYNINNLDDYFSNTDLLNDKISSLSGIEQIYAQYILHAQNATIISGIIKFNKNFDFIKSTLKDFSPSQIISFYKINPNDKNHEKSANLLVKEFRKGLQWSTEKSEKPDTIIKRFTNTIIDGAIYFSRFADKQAVLKDLNLHYQKHDFRMLIDYLLDNFKHGFSVALCCDFLKELDSNFDLPKPDVHIMEVIAKYKGYPLDYYKKNSNKDRAYECIDDIIDIVNQIRKSECRHRKLTIYKFDRMIWLCCTGNFFLSGSGGSLKENLLNGINN